MIEIKINNESVTYKVGFHIEEHLNETLDSGLLVIPQSDKIDMEPMDRVEITGDYTKYMLISNIKSTYSHFQSPVKYNYELQLISPTIQLQRIVLPNRSITQPIVGPQKTIYDVLSGYIEIYAPQFTLDSAFIDKTELATCPEWQWNMPTLFEVFNDLLSAVDCVVTMPTFDTISVLDLNKQGNPINMNTVSNIEYNFSIEGYADRMEIEAKNVANKNKNATMYDVVVAKSNESIVTVANAMFIVAKPIFTVDEAIIVWFRSGGSGFPSATMNTNITDHIVERAVYDTYKVSNKIGIENGKDYKRNALYYIEGDNKIYGLGYRESSFLPIQSQPALINIVADVEGYNNGQMSTFVPGAEYILQMGLIIKYTTLEDVKFASLKTNKPKNSSTLINNQNTTYVDIGALSIAQQRNIDRIGNAEMQIYGRDSNVPSLADYIDNYKVTARIIKFEVGWLDFTAKLSRDYIIKEMFTGLNSKRRYLQFAQANDAFLSNHLLVNEYRFQNENAELDNILTEYFMSIGKPNLYPKIAVVRTRNESNIAVVGLAGSTSLIENGIIYNFKFDDNINAGYKVTKESEAFGNVLKVNNTPYVDDKGEFKYIEYRLFKDINNQLFTLGGKALARARNYPSIEESMLDYNDIIYNSDEFIRYKDNREITSETLQFTFRSNNNIIVGKKYFELNPMIYKESTVKNLYIMVSDSQTYGKYDTKGIGFKFLNPADTLIVGNYVTLNMSDTWWNNYNVKSWAVVDEENNIILANNGNQRRIYLIGGAPYTRIFGNVRLDIVTSYVPIGEKSTNIFGSTALPIFTFYNVVGEKSTNIFGSVLQPVGVDIRIDGEKSTNIFGSVTLPIFTFYDVGEEVSTDYSGSSFVSLSVDIISTGEASTNINDEQSLNIGISFMPTGLRNVWLSTTSTSYNGTVSSYIGTNDANTITSWLNSNYPAKNYASGFVMRIRMYNYNGTVDLGTTYRIKGD